MQAVGRNCLRARPTPLLLGNHKSSRRVLASVAAAAAAQGMFGLILGQVETEGLTRAHFPDVQPIH